MSVKLELYRVFKEVAEAGNITAAAQALYISQSAVSQSIKQLERREEIRHWHLLMSKGEISRRIK